MFAELEKARSLLTQESAAGAPPDAEPPEVSQRVFARHRRQAEWTEWFRRTQDSPAARAWAQSTTGKGAAAWLGPPTQAEQFIPDPQFRCAVQMRLGMPVRGHE